MLWYSVAILVLALVSPLTRRSVQGRRILFVGYALVVGAALVREDGTAWRAFLAVLLVVVGVLGGYDLARVRPPAASLPATGPRS